MLLEKRWVKGISIINKGGGGGIIYGVSFFTFSYRSKLMHINLH